MGQSIIGGLKEAVLREAIAAAMAKSIAPYAKHLVSMNADDKLQVGCWIARRQIDAVMDALAASPTSPSLGEGEPLSATEELPAIPAGMVPWAGGAKLVPPDDWTPRSSVLFRCGETSRGATEYFWDHVGSNYDIIAYTPRSADAK